MILCVKLFLAFCFLLGAFYIRLTYVHQFDPKDEIELQSYSEFTMPRIPEQDEDPFLKQSTKYLTDLELLWTPEDLEVDEQTEDIYTGLYDGRIVRIQNQDIKTMEVIAKTQGQILGFGFSRDKKSLIFIASGVGLQRLNLQSKNIETIIDQIDGVKMNTTAPNSFVETSRGQFYFTVSSDRIVMADYIKDVLRRQANGKLYHYDPKKGKVEKIVDGLYFANGIVLEEGEESVLVAQTTQYRVTRVWVGGKKKGTSQTVIDNLPGYVDNLYWGKPNQVWVPIVAWRSPTSELFFATKFFRNVLIYFQLDHILESFIDDQYVGGAKVDTKTGQIIQWVIGRSKRMKYATTMLQKNGKLYIGCLKSPTIAIIDLNDNTHKSNHQQTDL